MVMRHVLGEWALNRCWTLGSWVPPGPRIRLLRGSRRSFLWVEKFGGTVNSSGPTPAIPWLRSWLSSAVSGQAHAACAVWGRHEPLRLGATLCHPRGSVCNVPSILELKQTWSGPCPTFPQRDPGHAGTQRRLGGNDGDAPVPPRYCETQQPGARGWACVAALANSGPSVHVQRQLCGCQARRALSRDSSEFPQGYQQWRAAARCSTRAEGAQEPVETFRAS
mmetsp:Transcript_12136/g.28045  ORF Transcript_12136/g.28045 Transcript_12136/m.28045 type:complete len:222 (+) Transcript_12136:1071-1736(+)